jgi:hypothetical protein
VDKLGRPRLQRQRAAQRGRRHSCGWALPGVQSGRPLSDDCWKHENIPSPVPASRQPPGEQHAVGCSARCFEERQVQDDDVLSKDGNGRKDARQAPFMNDRPVSPPGLRFRSVRSVEPSRRSQTPAAPLALRLLFGLRPSLTISSVDQAVGVTGRSAGHRREAMVPVSLHHRRNRQLALVLTPRISSRMIWSTLPRGCYVVAKGFKSRRAIQLND